MYRQARIEEDSHTDGLGPVCRVRAARGVPHRRAERPRAQLLATWAGDNELRIPKPGLGSFFPVIFEPRRWIDQGSNAVVMEAYVNGGSSRSVDDLVAALDIQPSIAKSQVSRICAEVSRICAGLDEVVTAFRTR